MPTTVMTSRCLGALDIIPQETLFTCIRVFFSLAVVAVMRTHFLIVDEQVVPGWCSA